MSGAVGEPHVAKCSIDARWSRPKRIHPRSELFDVELAAWACIAENGLAVTVNRFLAGRQRIDFILYPVVIVIYQ